MPRSYYVILSTGIIRSMYLCVVVSFCSHLFFTQIFRDLVIDESLMKFRGRTSYRQYIPTKRARFGLKFFSLCDLSGYVLDIEFYGGRASTEEWAQGVPNAANLSASERIVVHLLDRANHLDVGHHLVVDNYYNSTRLQEFLLTRDTLCTGVIRPNRGLSDEIRQGRIPR